MSRIPITSILRMSEKNPRYSADDHYQAIYLIGCHTWNTLIDQLA